MLDWLVRDLPISISPTRLRTFKDAHKKAVESPSQVAPALRELLGNAGGRALGTVVATKFTFVRGLTKCGAFVLLLGPQGFQSIAVSIGERLCAVLTQPSQPFQRRCLLA